jgi:hypothetical protein
MTDKERYKVSKVSLNDNGWIEEVQLLDYQTRRVIFLYIDDSAMEDMDDEDLQEPLMRI